MKGSICCELLIQLILQGNSSSSTRVEITKFDLQFFIHLRLTWHVLLKPSSQYCSLLKKKNLTPNQVGIYLLNLDSRKPRMDQLNSDIFMHFFKVMRLYNVQSFTKYFETSIQNWVISDFHGNITSWFCSFFSHNCQTLIYGSW